MFHLTSKILPNLPQVDLMLFLLSTSSNINSSSNLSVFLKYYVHSHSTECPLYSFHIGCNVLPALSISQDLNKLASHQIGSGMTWAKQKFSPGPKASSQLDCKQLESKDPVKYLLNIHLLPTVLRRVIYIKSLKFFKWEKKNSAK
jgi:hypothetical protein